MSQSLTIARTIGSTERAMRALIDREFESSALTFPEWTALVFTSGSMLEAAELAARQIAGHIVSDAKATMDVVDGLLARDLLVRDGEGRLMHAETGKQLFERLSAVISGITVMLVEGLSPIDLDTTERTLREIGARADKLLRARS